MSKDFEPKQGAFFPGEDGSITDGKVEVSQDGTPLVGKKKLLRELLIGNTLALNRIGELNGLLRQAGVEQLEELGIEVDNNFDALKRNLDMIAKLQGFPRLEK